MGRHRFSRGGPAGAAALLALCGCGGPPEPAPAPPPAPPAAAPGPRVFPLENAALLDDPERDAWQRPDAVVAALGIRPGMRIGDVGCGTGYFTDRLLRASAPGGTVLAVDVQQGMLDLLARRLDPAARGRVTLRRTEPDRPLEPGDALDLVLCANTLYEVEPADAPRFVARMAGGLAPGGRLAILDWLPKPTGMGPPGRLRLPPARIRELAEGAGLRCREDLDLLPTHSFQVFEKPR